MSEAIAYAIVIIAVLLGISFGVWMGLRANRKLGLPTPDGSGPMRRKIPTAILLIAVVWGVIWFQTGLRELLDLIIPTIFSVVVLVIIFRGIKRS